MSAVNAQSYDPALISDPFFQVHITHLPTNKTISFKGWVTTLDDSYTSTWNTETVYGRMDPLATFHNTARKITLGFDVPAGDGPEGADNLAKLNRLVEFLYPVYTSGDRTIQNTLKAGPLIGLKWTNMVGNAATGDRLIGFLDGLTYAPELEQGAFFSTGNSTETTDITTPGETQEGYLTRAVSNSSNRAYVPKLYKISLGFTVIHTHLTGWYGSRGNYTFGNSDVDAKFPNAHSVVNTFTQVQQSDVGGGDDDAYENVGEIQQSQETEVLEPGIGSRLAKGLGSGLLGPVGSGLAALGSGLFGGDD